MSDLKPLGQPTGDPVEWLKNAIKDTEKWARDLGSKTVPYSNAVSGLDAKNAQDAIDETQTIIADMQTVIDGILALLDYGNVPIGGFIPYAGGTAPAKWLLCYGQNVSRSTYASLFAALTRSATVTITIASPAVVSWTAHGLGAGDPVVFRTTGALPTGLTAGTVYFVISAGLAADSFRVSATPGGAAINTSGTQSGVHTGWYAPHGDGDGSTTFGIPDLRGRAVAGQDDMGGTSANRLTGLTNGIDGDVLGGTGGEQSHTPTLAETFAHAHSFTYTLNTNTTTGGVVNRVSALATTGLGSGLVTDSQGSSTAHNNVQPTAIHNYIIFAGV